MQYMIIRGNVKGGHTLKDLGLTIAYGQEVPIPVQRAGYSRDLSYALKSKSVVKVGQRALSPSPLPPTARVKPPVAPVKTVKRKTPPPPPTPEQQERDELREMNRKLMDTISTLTESQQALLDKLSEVVDKGGGLGAQTIVVQAPPEPAPQKSVKPSEAPTVHVEDEDDWEEDEPVIFIPSKIRSDKTTVSDNTAVTEETKEASDKMDQASQALAAMKKGRKTRRTKKTTDES